MRTSVFFVLCLAFLLTGIAAAEPETEPAPPPVAEEATEPADQSERAKVLAFVEDLRADAARIRGLEWKETIPADVLSRDQLRENYIKAMEKETTPEERERDTRILRRFGIIGPDEDPFEMIIEAMEKMVGGYYNPEEKKLYLIEGMTGEAQKPVILHELIHALEDQYIDLKARLEQHEDDSDRIFAEKCIGEGSAEIAREIYQEENPDVARAYRMAQQDPSMAAGQMEALQKIPALFIVPTLLHYQLGPAFVRRALGKDLAGGMDAIYANPPVSQEQLMHPAKWFGELQDFPQKAVWSEDLAEVAGEGWEKVHDGTVGELDLATYLDFFLGSTNGRLNLMMMGMGQIVVPRARVAAVGWDGGHYYVMEKEGLPAAWIEVLAFDSVLDASEAASALLEVLRTVSGDEYELVSAEETVGDDGGAATFTVSYEGKHGPGRLLRRGNEIILVDGVPQGIFDRVWNAALETTFERDERDTWDLAKAEDPFAGCSWVNRDAGVGLVLPEGWAAKAAEGMPAAIAVIEKESVTAQLVLIPMPFETLEPVLKAELKNRLPGVDLGAPETVPVAGVDGQRFRGPGFALYMAGVAGKTLILRGESATLLDMETARAELAEIAEGIVIVEQ